MGFAPRDGPVRRTSGYWHRIACGQYHGLCTIDLDDMRAATTSQALLRHESSRRGALPSIERLYYEAAERSPASIDDAMRAHSASTAAPMNSAPSAA